MERDGRDNIAGRVGRNNEHRVSGALVWYILFAGLLHPIVKYYWQHGKVYCLKSSVTNT